MLLSKALFIFYFFCFPLFALQAPKELPISKGECPKVADALEGVCSKKTRDENNQYWEFIENNYEIIRQTYSKVVNVFSCVAFRDFVENACSSHCAGDDCIWKISLEALETQKEALPPAPIPNTDTPGNSPKDPSYQDCDSCGFYKKNENKNQTSASSNSADQELKNKKPSTTSAPTSATYEAGQGKTLNPETGKDYSPGYMLWGTPGRKKAPLKKY